MIELSFALLLEDPVGIHFGDELLYQVGAFSPSSYHAEEYRNARKKGTGGRGEGKQTVTNTREKGKTNKGSADDGWGRKGVTFLDRREGGGKKYYSTIGGGRGWQLPIFTSSVPEGLLLLLLQHPTLPHSTRTNRTKNLPHLLPPQPTPQWGRELHRIKAH